MLKSKRGEGLHIGFTMLYILVFGAILVVMAFVLFFITNEYIDGFLVYDKDIPKHVYAYRAINTCLAYQDNVTKRYYPGIIDFSKYNEEVLKDCYVKTEGKSFNVQLRDLEKPEDYSRILIGFGASLSIEAYPVWIKYADGTINEGELLFGVS